MVDEGMRKIMYLEGKRSIQVVLYDNLCIKLL